MAQAVAEVRTPKGLVSTYVATLQHAAKTQGVVQTANKDRWRCFERRCEGIVVRQSGVSACQALARAEGPISSFAIHRTMRLSRKLNAAQLRQCNGDGQRTSKVGVHGGGSVPNTVKTAPLVLVGKPQVADSYPLFHEAIHTPDHGKTATKNISIRSGPPPACGGSLGGGTLI